MMTPKLKNNPKKDSPKNYDDPKNEENKKLGGPENKETLTLKMTSKIRRIIIKTIVNI